MITGIDHIALPTGDPEACLAFYKAIGCQTLNEDDWRAGKRPSFSVLFGPNKINFHASVYTELRGPTATPGCGDVCFVWGGDVASVTTMLGGAGVEVIHGPAERAGGRGGGTKQGVSVYVRDPDQNLVEFICYTESM